jgi:hypothetical protein
MHAEVAQIGRIRICSVLILSYSYCRSRRIASVDNIPVIVHIIVPCRTNQLKSPDMTPVTTGLAFGRPWFSPYL